MTATTAADAADARPPAPNARPIEVPFHNLARSETVNARAGDYRPEGIDELAALIRLKGLIQPLTVRAVPAPKAHEPASRRRRVFDTTPAMAPAGPDGAGRKSGRYEIVAGAPSPWRDGREREAQEVRRNVVRTQGPLEGLHPRQVRQAHQARPIEVGRVQAPEEGGGTEDQVREEGRVTTIAIDKFGTIAADGLACFGDERHRTDVTKIHVREATPKGDRPARIFAVCGPRGMTDALIAWYEAGHDPKAVPPGPFDGSGWSLVVVEAGRVWNIGSSCPYPTAVALPFAWGSGGDYAKGLLRAGFTARKAVEIACELDTGSGGEIQEVNIAEALRLPKVREAAE